MTGLGGNYVGKEEDVVENTLCTKAQHTEPDGRFTYGHECHQVHALIFSLLQQGMYPTRITLHQTEGAKMPEGCRDHARNAGDCFEEDDSLVKSMRSAHGAHFEIGGDLQRAIEPGP